MVTLVYRYWALGFHQCRYGYPNVETLSKVVTQYANNKVRVNIIIDNSKILSLPDTIGYNVD